MGICCEYNKKGLLSAVVLADGSKYDLAYKDGLAQGVRGPNGELALLVWDAASHLKSLSMYLTEKHPFYNAKDARGKKVLIAEFSISCDRAGRLLEVVNTSGEKFSARYFVSGADKKRGITKFERCTLTNPDGAATYGSNEWRSDSTKVIERGRVSRDNNGNVGYEPTETMLMVRKASSLVCAEAVRMGRKQQFSHGGATLAITAETNPLGQVTKHEYDKQGLKTSTTNPDGSTVSFERDPQGRLTAIVNEVVRRTTYKYSTDNALLELDEAGIVTRYEYDHENRPVKTILPGDFVHRFSWDALSRLVEHISPDGVSVKYRYAGGLPNVVSIETVPSDSKADSLTANYVYDPQGRLILATYADDSSESFAYDCCALVKSVDRTVPPLATPTTRATGKSWKPLRAAHDTVRIQCPGATDTDDVSRWPCRTLRLRLRRQTSGHTAKGWNHRQIPARRPWPENSGDLADGRHTDCSYDWRGYLRTVKGGDGRDEERQYNLAGQLISSSEEGRRTTRDYDEHGRLFTQTTPGGSEQTFFYLPGTNLVQGTLADDVLTFHRFDKAGRKVSTSKIPGTCGRRPRPTRKNTDWWTATFPRPTLTTVLGT